MFCVFISSGALIKIKNITMNIEVDDTTEFYHQDFTTASEWEVFIARIEEIITQWKKDEYKDIENYSMSWLVRTESLNFMDFHYNLSHYCKKNLTNEQRLINQTNPFLNDNDFDLDFTNDNKLKESSDKHHVILSTWYGIEEFIVLYPATQVGINSESKIKLLLSSLYIVTNNIKCECPLFIQALEPWQQYYLGVYEYDGIYTNLEMVHLKYRPRLCEYLSGLLDLYRSKIFTPTMTTVSSTDIEILISLQSTYELEDFSNYYYEYKKLDLDKLDENIFKTLPLFGVCIEPINSISLKVLWSEKSHREIRDCESFTTFNPFNTSKWSLTLKPVEKCACLLGEALEEFLKISTNLFTVHDILGDYAYIPPLNDNKNSTSKITTLFSKAARNSIGKLSRQDSTVGPLSEYNLATILYYVFPDAKEDSINTYKNLFEVYPHTTNSLKSCPIDSLVWRLGIVLLFSLQSLGGIKAFVHIWFEFVQEMRYRWENICSIPGLTPGSPDMRTCLLYQKLQMLNCCIDARKIRENTKFNINPTENSSDDEFFDCADVAQSTTTIREKYSLWNQPIGRLGKFNNLKLIETGDFLYVPITQEPVPKCEDQLEEDTKVLLQLGTDAQGSELRAKMMSASLLSDMESFKAANPGSILEDFIRWYSPRDWIEIDDEFDKWEQKKGYLSSRMLIEDNFWKQTWNSAKPVPANRQKKLFDDVREAEKILYFLESRNISQICELLLPIICYITVNKLKDEIPLNDLDELNKKYQNLVKIGEKISKGNHSQIKRFENFLLQTVEMEVEFGIVNSLILKFSQDTNKISLNFINNLIKGNEIEINESFNSLIGKRLIQMFTNASKNSNMMVSKQNKNFDNNDNENDDEKDFKFPQPNERNIVFRVAIPRPASYSRQCPQFMRAIITKNEFRLIGAFSQDKIFF